MNKMEKMQDLPWCWEVFLCASNNEFPGGVVSDTLTALAGGFLLQQPSHTSTTPDGCSVSYCRSSSSYVMSHGQGECQLKRDLFF